MNNLNFFANSYFHCEPQLSQHVDINLTRNVCNPQSIPASPPNGYNTSIWSFSSTLGSASLTNEGSSRLNNNEQSTAPPTQPIYAWMKKKRGNAEGKKDRTDKTKQPTLNHLQGELSFLLPLHMLNPNAKGLYRTTMLFH